MRLPGIQKERGTHAGANRRMPSPCSKALFVIVDLLLAHRG
jgi:hypothetical protein